LLSPYPLQENKEYSSEFVTDQKIKYAIYFLDYSYLFERYPLIAQGIYAFNIDVIEGNSGTSIEDERIAITILKVFTAFFAKIQNVAVYVCDSMDSRQVARK
jgi:hypothetical protein